MSARSKCPEIAPHEPDGENTNDEPFVVLVNHSPPVIVPRAALTEKHAEALERNRIAVPAKSEHQKIAWSLIRQSNPNFKFWRERFLQMIVEPEGLCSGWADFLAISISDHADCELANHLERFVEDSLLFRCQCPLANAAHEALVDHAVNHWRKWHHEKGRAIESDTNWRDPFDRAIQEGISVVKIFLHQHLGAQ